jgi:hypothetical protein
MKETTRKTLDVGGNTILKMDLRDTGWGDMSLIRLGKGTEKG